MNNENLNFGFSADEDDIEVTSSVTDEESVDSSTNRQLVYSYGDGNKVFFATADDVLVFNNNTLANIRGVQTLEDGNRTVIVFNDFTSLNVYGKPKEIIFDNNAVSNSEEIERTTEDVFDFGATMSMLEASSQEAHAIYADTSDVIDLADLGVSSANVRGIKQYESGTRTFIALNDFNYLNIYGRPGAVVLDGQTIISNEPDTTSWEDTYADAYTYNYGDGNKTMFADEDDIINLSSVTWDEIRGVSVEDASSRYVFNDWSTLNVLGPASTVLIDNNAYNINYSDKAIQPQSSNE